MRLFIGIPVGGRCQRQIDECLRTLVPARRRWRWIPESNRHMTLAFMGSLPVQAGADLARVFAAEYASVKSFQYRFSVLQRFPHRSASLIALTGDSIPPMDRLVRVTRSLLQREGIDFDQVKFRPHITLARTGRPGRADAVIEIKTDIRLDVERVALYESTLDRSGSVYSVLATARLRSPATRDR